MKLIPGSAIITYRGQTLFCHNAIITGIYSPDVSKAADQIEVELRREEERRSIQNALSQFARIPAPRGTGAPN